MTLNWLTVNYVIQNRTRHKAVYIVINKTQWILEVAKPCTGLIDF